MSELLKLAAAQCGLRKRADDLAAQIADAERRLTKLESKDDWPSFYETVLKAPGTGAIHQAPERMQ